MAKNAYVKLSVRPNGTFLTLYPPVEGGRNLIIDEVESYLDKVIPGGYEKVVVREELKKSLLSVREVLIKKEAYIFVSLMFLFNLFFFQIMKVILRKYL